MTTIGHYGCDDNTNRLAKPSLYDWCNHPGGTLSSSDCGSLWIDYLCGPVVLNGSSHINTSSAHSLLSSAELLSASSTSCCSCCPKVSSCVVQLCEQHLAHCPAGWSRLAWGRMLPYSILASVTVAHCRHCYHKRMRQFGSFCCSCRTCNSSTLVSLRSSDFSCVS